MRLFIAINLPADQRRAIFQATVPLREALPTITWVAEDRLHFTLKFLGEQPQQDVRALETALGDVVGRHRAISVEMGGVGAFPNLRAPRVVWLGVEHESKLELLQHDIESACAGLGYDVEGRPFRPHITLGRVKRELGRSEVQVLEALVESVHFADELDVRSVDLMSSVLAGHGAAYSLLAALPLRPALADTPQLAV